MTAQGHGWGNRVVYAMISGCIPVIIQDGIHQPYDDILPCAPILPPPAGTASSTEPSAALTATAGGGGDYARRYREFSLRLPQSEIDNLPSILRAVTPEEIRELQHGVQKYHRAFFWKQARAPRPPLPNRGMLGYS